MLLDQFDTVRFDSVFKLNFVIETRNQRRSSENMSYIYEVKSLRLACIIDITPFTKLFIIIHILAI